MRNLARSLLHDLDRCLDRDAKQTLFSVLVRRASFTISAVATVAAVGAGFVRSGFGLPGVPGWLSLIAVLGFPPIGVAVGLGIILVATISYLVAMIGLFVVFEPLTLVLSHSIRRKSRMTSA
ncbi:MAG TPA: hypothetical protein VHB47_21175 [Thermoanaerobaculia bacterium]|jgi:hypothetical protein|nr:hypothetical protein [Thermoanaerobaculia bacterium]